MSTWKFLCIPLFLVLLIIIPNANGEAYWGNLKVDLEKVDRLPGGDGSDVIRVKAKITNNDNEEITIYYRNVLLQDDRHRLFSSSNYFDLAEKHRVTEKQCPWEFSIELNPGLSEDGSFCFEVPEEKLTFTLWFYERSPDYCINPTYGSCQDKSVRLNVAAPAPSAPTPAPPASSPSSSEDTSSSFLQGTVNELEQQVNSLENQLSSKNVQLSLKDRDLVAKDQQITDLKVQLAEKDEQIAKKDAVLLEQLRVISDLVNMIKNAIYEQFVSLFSF